MTASPPVSDVLPGVHRVRKARSGGRIGEYWYAWRGGPQILNVVAASDALLAREIARKLPDAIARYRAEVAGAPADDKFLYGLITRYLAAMAEDTSLADRTKKDRRKHLDKARAELGDMELRALEAKGARAVLIAWRDRYRATPKTADDLLGDLSTVLQWALDRGEIGVNPAKDFPRLYKSNRAEIIWEPQHLATLFPHCAEELNHAVRLAALTGLRLGDLIKLPRTAIGEHAIVWQTSKSRRRKTVVIPLTPPLRALLAEIPARDSVTLLNSARKKPWTESGLESALRRARLDALAAARERTGDPETTSGIEPLRFHDLRGTAATNFLRAGLELGDVATILGWSKSKVEGIALRYVTAQEVGLAMVERLRKNAPKTKAVNRPVNRALGGKVARPKS